MQTISERIKDRAVLAAKTRAFSLAYKDCVEEYEKVYKKKTYMSESFYEKEAVNDLIEGLKELKFDGESPNPDAYASNLFYISRLIMKDKPKEVSSDQCPQCNASIPAELIHYGSMYCPGCGQRLVLSRDLANQLGFTHDPIEFEVD